MVGFGGNRRGGRLPSLLFAALLLVIAALAFNSWSSSSRQTVLQEEVAELQGQAKRGDVARGRLEKRNSELLLQVEAHKKSLEQREADCSQLSGQLQAKDGLVRKCEDGKQCPAQFFYCTCAACEIVHGHAGAPLAPLALSASRVQRNSATAPVQVMKLCMVNQMCHSPLALSASKVQRNSSTAPVQVVKLCTDPQLRLGFSFQCGQQIKELRIQHEEDMKKMEEQVLQDQKATHGSQFTKDIERGLSESPKVVKATQKLNEVKNEAPSTNNISDGKEKIKLGDDAGMPGIEENDPAKGEDTLTALKKPLFSTSQNQHQPGGSVFTEKTQTGANEGNTDLVNQVPPNYLQRAIPDHTLDIQKNKKQLAKQTSKERTNDFQRMKQNRFFDENESPVDPQHGSKLADYNGDDGNVGEYEADKQAELAYNEEEDGDGGEEDVQDDEERELQMDLVDYGKPRFNDVL
ncbi:protein GOLM2 [Erythrolamprus reginae]|uniref:protein GOLM2 n=1 Tax=Erythrolamprus reginae TaxID=121349 RepID=UPI00396C81A5